MTFTQRNIDNLLKRFDRAITAPILPYYYKDPIETMERKLGFFDKEGFGLTELEVQYANANDFEFIDRGFGQRAIGTEWYENKDIQKYHPNFYIDHSFIMFRPYILGEARAQIQNNRKSLPKLAKLINIRPKMGLDISVEFIDGDFITEVFHIEKDYYTYEGLKKGIFEIQSHLANDILWDRAIDQLRAITPLISHMPSDDQSDIKAHLFGFDRTYNTLKVV
jgi:hypothetical protein